MATKYELPEEVTVKRLRTLGKEVKMKTFKTNVAPEEETSDGDCLIKIICVGGMIGPHTKDHQRHVYQRLLSNLSSRNGILETSNLCKASLENNKKAKK